MSSDRDRGVGVRVVASTGPPRRQHVRIFEVDFEVLYELAALGQFMDSRGDGVPAGGKYGSTQDFAHAKAYARCIASARRVFLP